MLNGSREGRGRRRRFYEKREKTSQKDAAAFIKTWLKRRSGTAGGKRRGGSRLRPDSPLRNKYFDIFHRSKLLKDDGTYELGAAFGGKLKVLCTDPFGFFCLMGRNC